jgi:hypothetical protein
MSRKEIRDYRISRPHPWIVGFFVLFDLYSPEFISPSKEGIWEVPALFPFVLVNQLKRLHLEHVGVRRRNQNHSGFDFVVRLAMMHASMRLVGHFAPNCKFGPRDGFARTQYALEVQRLFSRLGGLESDDAIWIDPFNEPECRLGHCDLP